MFHWSRDVPEFPNFDHKYEPDENREHPRNCTCQECAGWDEDELHDANVDREMEDRDW